MTHISFEVVASNIDSWSIVRLPKNASARLPSRGQVMARGTVNGVPFVAPLEPDGVGGHWFKIDGTMAASIDFEPKKALVVELAPTDDWPESDVPGDFRSAIDASPEAAAVWASLTTMARWEWVRWISSTANPETRKRRIEVACSKMENGKRRPCCFNRSMCCVPEVSRGGILIGAEQVGKS